MRIATRSPYKRILLFLLVIAVISVANRVEASNGMRADKCTINKNELITEDFYFLCRVLDVYGTVDGDLIGVAASVTIHRGAVITGEIWVGGGKLVVDGTVGNDIHFGGLTVSITNMARFTNTKTDLTSVALDTQIEKDAVLPGGLLVYGYQVTVDGAIGGDINFRGEALTINGVTGGGVKAEVGDSRRRPNLPDLPLYNISFKNPGLLVGSNAYIGGDLSYRTTQPSLIPDDVVKGRIRFTRTGQQPDITKVAQPNDAAVLLRDYMVAALRDALTLLVVGTLGLWLVPGFVRQPAQRVRRRTISTIGSGLVVTFMFLVPLVIAVVVLGLIIVLILYFLQLNALTILIGVGLLVVTAGLISGSGLLLFFMGRVVICFLIGQLVYRYVLREPEPGLFRQWIVTLAIGALGYALITDIPVPALGTIIELITALAGVGAVVMYGRDVIRTFPAFASRFEPVPEPAGVLPEVMAAPLGETYELPGMDNLPSGFRGFDDSE